MPPAETGQPDYEIQPLDPLGGQHRLDGSILAPMMSFAAAMDRSTARI